MDFVRGLLGIFATAPGVWVLSAPIIIAMLWLKDGAYWVAVALLPVVGIVAWLLYLFARDPSCQSATCPGAWTFIGFIFWGMFCIIWIILAPLLKGPDEPQ